MGEGAGEVATRFGSMMICTVFELEPVLGPKRVTPPSLMLLISHQVPLRLHLGRITLRGKAAPRVPRPLAPTWRLPKLCRRLVRMPRHWVALGSDKRSFPQGARCQGGWPLGRLGLSLPKYMQCWGGWSLSVVTPQAQVSDIGRHSCEEHASFACADASAQSLRNYCVRRQPCAIIAYAESRV